MSWGRSESSCPFRAKAGHLIEVRSDSEGPSSGTCVPGTTRSCKAVVVSFCGCSRTVSSGGRVQCGMQVSAPRQPEVGTTHSEWSAVDRSHVKDVDEGLQPAAVGRGRHCASVESAAGAGRVPMPARPLYNCKPSGWMQFAIFALILSFQTRYLYKVASGQICRSRDQLAS